MQNQIYSYSFPLSENCENSYLSSLRSKSFLIAGAESRSGTSPTSLLHLFKYEEENPKKSSSHSRKINGTVLDLVTAEDEKRNLKISLVLVKDGKYKIQKISDEKITSEEECLETLHQQSEKINGVFIKKDISSFYLWENSKINSFDLQKQAVTPWVTAPGKITCLTVDSTHEYLTYVVDGKQIHICDKRSNNEKFLIKGSQRQDKILNMDYNPNKQCYLMTCHHESVKFWDIRRGNVPVRCYDDHHNLLTEARYNHSHDELIACAYDDGSVGLLRLHSVCSSPQSQIEDTMVKLYDQHEDSVFKVVWSAFSPWLFASATYNASNLVLNIVPNVEKYRILL